MFRRLRWLGCSCVLAMGLAFSQTARAADTCPEGSAVGASAKDKHPAVFRVENGKGTVYFLASMHVLPPKFGWCTPLIGQIIAKADAFVFEANLDFANAEFHYFMDHGGYLPRGQTLHEKLSPDAQKRYFSLIKDRGLDANRLDYLQPGVAVLLLQGVTPSVRIRLVPGVDPVLETYAEEHGKVVGYLESLQSQLDVLKALGGGAQVAILEKELLKMGKAEQKFPPMLAAWAKGDLETLRAMDDTDPQERETLLDKRNKAWLPRIEAFLDMPKTYLVTVGALHLNGPNSVIDLLCGKGWKVERLPASAPSLPVKGESACRAYAPWKRS